MARHSDLIFSRPLPRKSLPFPLRRCSGCLCAPTPTQTEDCPVPQRGWPSRDDAALQETITISPPKGEEMVWEKKGCKKIWMLDSIAIHSGSAIRIFQLNRIKNIRVYYIRSCSQNSLKLQCSVPGAAFRIDGIPIFHPRDCGKPIISSESLLCKLETIPRALLTSQDIPRP